MGLPLSSFASGHSAPELDFLPTLGLSHPQATDSIESGRANQSRLDRTATPEHDKNQPKRGLEEIGMFLACKLLDTGISEELPGCDDPSVNLPFFRRPTMEPFLVKKLPRFRGFFPWNFGVPRDISPNLTRFDPVLTNSDLF